MGIYTTICCTKIYLTFLATSNGNNVLKKRFRLTKKELELKLKKTMAAGSRGDLRQVRRTTRPYINKYALRGPRRHQKKSNNKTWANKVLGKEEREREEERGGRQIYTSSSTSSSKFLF